MIAPNPAFSTAVVEPLPAGPPLTSAIRSFGSARLPAILDSSLPGPRYARFAVLCCDPVDSFEIWPGDETDWMNTLRPAQPQFACEGQPRELPFVAAWIGFVSYEAGFGWDRIAHSRKPSLGFPLARFSLYDTAAVYDCMGEQWYLTGVEWAASAGCGRPTLKSRFEELRRLLSRSTDASAHRGAGSSPSLRATPSLDRFRYLSHVRRIKRYIAAGDVYQVNLTQRFQTDTALTPAELYLRLRRETPSPYAAFLAWDDRAVISASPELFLECRDGHAVTRPIKGTRPRGNDARSDADYRRELQNSEKDRAELTMITDLLRNDLGRVAAYGSVRVTEAGEIEAHPTVYHRVATVEADLAPDRDGLDLLAAAFPGGSVTGAPKVRAMQIIDELEPTARGPYCGAIGWIGLDGSACFNLAIRTMVQRSRTVHAFAGGGIVADSDPEAEFEEMQLKAAAMLRALGCCAGTEVGVPEEAATR